jgi:hypothetical protein
MQNAVDLPRLVSEVDVWERYARQTGPTKSSFDVVKRAREGHSLAGRCRRGSESWDGLCVNWSDEDPSPARDGWD